tara:strand:- start:246 stop:470 length:225 start_codon:yes stop_codon:yes gene_type:complete
MVDKKSELTFEEGIQKLEKILLKLENEDTPLDQMITLYEEANNLTDICRKKLDEANQRMTKLVKGEDGKFLEQE